MQEDRLRLLTVTNKDIKNKMDAIIEAFVKFYGEEKREQVIQKIGNAKIFRVYNNDTLRSMIDNTIKYVLDSKFIKTFDIEDDQLLPKDYDQLFYELYNKKENGSEISIFNLCGLDPKEVIDNFQKGEYNELEEAYIEVKEITSEYEEEYLLNAQLEESIIKVCNDKLQREYEKLIPEDIRNVLGNEYNNSILCFTKREIDFYNKPSISVAQKEKIEINRMDLLRKFGFNKLSYEEYENDEEIKRFIDKYSLAISEFDKERKILLKEKNELIMCSTKNYKDNNNEFDNEHIMYDWIDDYYFYVNTVGSFTPNYMLKDDKMVYFANIILNLSIPFELLDSTIIHELNHSYEYFSGYEEDKSFIGWDTIDDNAKTNKDGFREYELISEYVNEVIAQEITDIMHNNGDYIYTINKESAYVSSYLTLDFLLGDFYNEFKDIIIMSRSNGNMNYLFDILGKDNFDELNELVTDFNYKIGIGYKIYNYLDYCSKNPNSIIAIYVNDLINKKNDIILKMKDRLNEKNL